MSETGGEEHTYCILHDPTGIAFKYYIFMEGIATALIISRISPFKTQLFASHQYFVRLQMLLFYKKARNAMAVRQNDDDVVVIC